MKDQMRLRFCAGDWFAVAAVVLLAAAIAIGFALHAAASPQVTVEVRLDGELLFTCPLEEDAVYTVEGDYANTVTVRDGKAAVTASDCPGADCVHSGWIGAAGRAVICLPNRMELRLVGAADDVDIIVG